MIALAWVARTSVNIGISVFMLSLVERAPGMTWCLGVSVIKACG